MEAIGADRPSELTEPLLLAEACKFMRLRSSSDKGDRGPRLFPVQVKHRPHHTQEEVRLTRFIKIIKLI